MKFQNDNHEMDARENMLPAHLAGEIGNSSVNPLTISNGGIWINNLPPEKFAGELKISNLECPIQVINFIIREEAATKTKFVECHFMNVGDIGVKAIKYRLSCYDAFGDPLNGSEEQNKKYALVDELTLNPEGVYGINIAVDLLSFSHAAEIIPEVQDVLFQDGTRWKNEGNSETTVFEIVETSLEIANALKNLAGEDAKQLAMDKKMYWVCVCGKTNSHSHSFCAHCMRKRAYVLENMTRMEDVEKALAEKIAAEKAEQKAKKERIEKEEAERQRIMKEADMREKRNKRRIFIVVASVILIVLISTAFAKEIHRVKAEIAIDKADTQSLITLNENARSSGSIDDEMRIAEKLCQRKDGEAENYLEERVLEGDAVYIEAVIKNQVKFQSLQPIIQQYLEGKGPTLDKVLGVQDGDRVLNEALSELNRDSGLLTLLHGLILASHPEKKGEFETAATKVLIADLIRKINQGESEEALSLVDEIEGFDGQKISGKGLEAFKEDMEKRNGLISEKEAAESEMNGIDLSKQIEGTDYFSLSAYIVGQNTENEYEIALADYDPYYGTIPSDKHGILVTKETTYSSKGRFTLNVRKGTDTEVTLKEEYGSFTQNWPVYEEVTSLEINEIQKEKAELAEARKRYQSLKKKIKVLDQKLKAFDGKRYVIGGSAVVFSGQ